MVRIHRPDRSEVQCLTDPYIGYRTILGRGVVASHTRKAIQAMLPEVLASCREVVGIAAMGPFDFDWALHPGSPVIVDVIKEMPGLEDHHVRVTNGIYKARGNSGSASVLAVLSQLSSMASGRDHVISAAYGPGINVEMVILRRCPGRSEDSD